MHHNHEQQQPLCELRIADSIFLGYVCTHPTLTAIEQYRQDLIDHFHSNAAHVPYAASTTEDSGGENSPNERYDDDDEPTGAQVGMTLLRELGRYKKQLRRQSTIRIRGGSGGNNNNNRAFESEEEDEDDGEECSADNSNNNGGCGAPIATAIIIVRYIQKRLLGVTCGRLRSVFERTARLALYRHLNGRNLPFVERYNFGESNWNNLYGLGAGDTELILDVVPLDTEESAAASSQSSKAIVQKLLSELQFEGMVGSQNELLPRLQNLQADLPIVGNSNQSTKNSIMPVYRYPGNYSGTEWPTHPWSPTSLSIKRSVETALQPLYIQHMNHCVTNLYRNGADRIDRHSDKDLDLNREGVIVSVSLGSARVMELRDRTFPHDVARVELPPNSMFVLGPFTNARFTHAVLPLKDDELEGREQDKRDSFCKGESNEEGRDVGSNAICSVEGGGRISLTFRDVHTFLDGKTQRLFGQGVASSIKTPILLEDGVITEESLTKAVQSTREGDKRERTSAMAIALGIGATAGYVSSMSSSDGSKLDASKGDAATKSDKLALLRSISTMVISASASYWYLQRSRSKIRQQRDEKEARVFFSKKSASGNKY